MTPFSTDSISILLADDHRLVRSGLKHILAACGDLVVVAEAETGHDALAILRERRIDVAVVDLTMPGLSGMELIRRMKDEYPRVSLLVLTMHAEEQYALRAFRAGANGYLTKDVASGELVAAIRKVASGGAYVTPAMAERLAMDLSERRSGPPHTLLSDRELDIFRRIVSGKRLTEIAEDIHVSVKTVSTHKSHILEKLQLDSAADLIKYALQHELFGDANAAT